MSDSVKKYLGWAGIFALVLIGYSSYKYASVYDRSISSPRSFSVSGDGKAIVIPDVASFTFSVITEGGKDIASLQNKNTEKVNSAINFLKESGVESKDIKTEGYNINPRYKNNSYYSSSSSLPPEIIGYTISQTVSVKVRDFSKTGDILSGVVKAGANSVSSLSFTLDDPTLAENQAREEAIEKAEKKAKEIAKAAGFHLGKLIYISDNNYYPYYANKTMSSTAYGIGGDMREAVVPTIEPGSKEITINVSLTYEIR